MLSSGLCSYTQALERELRSSSRTLRTLDDSCAGLEQKLADQTKNAVEVLAGRLKVKLRFSAFRCLMAWPGANALCSKKQAGLKGHRIAAVESDAQLLRLQGRALQGFRAAKQRAIGLEHVGDMLFLYRMKILQVHLFMSWRLHCKAENFSKAWQTHKTELRERRQEVIRQALETDEAQDAIEDIDATSDVHSPADKQAHGQEDTQDQLAQLRALQAAAAQDATARAVRRAEDEATRARREAQEAAERLRLAQLEAREWLAALDAARLELAKAQSGNETGLAHEAVEEAAEYLQEVEAAKLRADAEVAQLQKAAAEAASRAAEAEEVLEKAQSAATAQLRAVEARKAAEEKVASKARAAVEAEKKAKQRAQAMAKKEAKVVKPHFKRLLLVVASMLVPRLNQKALPAAEAAAAAGGDVQAQDPVGATKSVREAPMAVLAEPFVSEQAEAIGREPEAVQESPPKDDGQKQEAPRREEARQKQDKEDQEVQQRAEKAEAEERRKQEEARREEERLLEEEKRQHVEDMRRKQEEELRQAEERRRFEEVMEENRRRLREEELERDRQKADQLADRMSAERQQELLSMCVNLWQEETHAAASERQRLEAKRKHEAEVRRMKEEALAKAERAADSIAEKMYRQHCELLLQEVFSCWFKDYKEAMAEKKEETTKKAYQEEKKRLQKEREAQAAEAESKRVEAERKALAEQQKLKEQAEAAEAARRHQEAELQALEQRTAEMMEKQKQQEESQLANADTSLNVTQDEDMKREAIKERELAAQREDLERQRRELQLQRDALEREALERQQAALQEQRRAGEQDLLPTAQQSQPEEARSVQRQTEQVLPSQHLDIQRGAMEREVFQRQQQVAAAEREALVEQIKAARQQQALEMEMLKEKVSEAEDARKNQQAELERLKEEVTRGSVYQEILQHFKLTHAVHVQETPQVHVAKAAPVVEVGVTQTAEISTRSISVEAVPEIPKLSRPRRPDPHSMELGLQQARMLERMLLKVVVQGWQAAVFEGWRLPQEIRVRQVPWQTLPEEPLVPRPRGPNFAMHAELAAQGLSKWSEPISEGPLSTADLYEANARAHATFARWAVNASQRHMAKVFEQRQAEASTAEDEAAERAVQRASESIEQAVQQDILLEELHGGTAWPPPLLPPRPVLPGDDGWQERVRASGRLFASASAATDMQEEQVLFVQSDGVSTSFHAHAPEGSRLRESDDANGAGSQKIIIPEFRQAVQAAPGIGDNLHKIGELSCCAYVEQSAAYKLLGGSLQSTGTYLRRNPQGYVICRHYTKQFSSCPLDTIEVLRFDCQKMQGASASAPSVRRLQRELQLIQQSPNAQVAVKPSSASLLEWHFVLHSLPADSPYSGGCYHGRLLFPNGYPHAPPTVVMVTPSGRLETGCRLCLSMTDFHPESWNPAWSVDTILTGLLSYFLSDAESGYGSIRASWETRRAFAEESWAHNLSDPDFTQLFPEFRSPQQSLPSARQTSSQTESQARECWICRDSGPEPLIYPCACRGPIEFRIGHGDGPTSARMLPSCCKQCRKHFGPKFWCVVLAEHYLHVMRRRRLVALAVWPVLALLWPQKVFVVPRAEAPGASDATSSFHYAESKAPSLEEAPEMSYVSTVRSMAGVVLGLLLAVAAAASAMAEDGSPTGFAEFARKGGKMDADVGCFFNQCGKQTKACFVEDGRCLKGATCLARCRGDPDCATQCFAEFGCPRLDAWLNCTVEKEQCVSVPAGTYDVRKFYAEQVPTKLKDFDVRKLEGKWYKVRGYNKKYDCYPCQTNVFRYNAAENTMETEVSLRLARLKSGGYWENTLTEKMQIQAPSDRSTLFAKGEIFGLSFQEEWYVLAADEDFVLTAYVGNNLQDAYRGGFVYARTPVLSAAAEAKVRAAAEKNGFEWSKFCIIDNACPAQPPVDYTPTSMNMDDVQDLFEWFAPGSTRGGTVKDSNFNGEY
ncbi:Ubiquitin-conjugating enzyme E2 J2 [Symbiodinium microadriaticum]|uniref:Ubiquitin-conjugating enzyme E2 J2 n=1 Tax=Symbiodinium microadriaticum TaxID=2951 RepID=A0A1Q9D3X9_SYMMI|nr:Ubiquitin-conjugating enzyme E2 J2 [Symbiodinium microadriaticum]